MRRALRDELSRPLDAIRERCAEVAARARSVRINPEGLERFAAGIPPAEVAAAGAEPLPSSSDPERLAAYVLTLDAVNFGSGWFPHLRKLRGHSGYRTISAHLLARFESPGPIPAAELRSIDAAAVAKLLAQTPVSAPVDELMALYAQGWRDLGELVETRYAGSFGALVCAASGSSEALVETLLDLPQYQDVARYDGRLVPFLKRAQITAADLDRTTAWSFADLDRLTIFADNLVPHVLRLDGVLDCSDDLEERIERGELLASGAPEEVELRACALHAVEGIVARLRGEGRSATAAHMDQWLWLRGGGERYKARPRHRTRCTFY